MLGRCIADKNFHTGWRTWATNTVAYWLLSSLFKWNDLNTTKKRDCMSWKIDQDARNKCNRAIIDWAESEIPMKWNGSGSKLTCCFGWKCYDTPNDCVWRSTNHIHEYRVGVTSNINEVQNVSDNHDFGRVSCATAQRGEQSIPDHLVELYERAF